ncbi:MAG: hypothetical protein SFU99_04455 [Saprospiraceae bacterium]|nr:hypothetical protein [Saprospiraceae bacterium]
MKIYSPNIYFSLLVIAFPFSIFSQEMQDSSILSRISKNYNALSSYLDTIEVVHTRNYSQEFIGISTAFVRPDSFRLEITWEKPDNYINNKFQKKVIISKLGKNNAMYWQQFGEYPPQLDSLDFNRAISRIVGISYNTGSFIPFLLMQDSLNRANRIFETGIWKRLSDEIIDDELCYKFQQIYIIRKDPEVLKKLKETGDSVFKQVMEGETGYEAIYWFRQKDSLLVKCHQKNQSSTYSSETIWTVNSVINQQMPLKTLQPNFPK